MYNCDTRHIQAEHILSLFLSLVASSLSSLLFYLFFFLSLSLSHRFLCRFLPFVFLPFSLSLVFFYLSPFLLFLFPLSFTLLISLYLSFSFSLNTSLSPVWMDLHWNLSLAFLIFFSPSIPLSFSFSIYDPSLSYSLSDPNLKILACQPSMLPIDYFYRTRLELFKEKIWPGLRRTWMYHSANYGI